MEYINFYDIAKVLHIISFVSWFAGLFYLPRIYVYHASIDPNSQTSEIFKIMEKKLYYYIMTPAMIATIIFGVYMASVISFNFIWLHAKITLVIFIIGFHHGLGKWRKNFAQNKNIHTEKFYRIINEIPTILLILIVILVIIKPF